VAELARRLGDYGFDAPHVPLLLGLGGAALLVLGALSGAAAPLVAGLLLAFSATTFVHTTRRGKFALWQDLLEAVGLRGDEHVLDLGCGRGGVLLMAAQLVPEGRAVGLDLWRSVDQSGNSEEATLDNAALEGVEDRVEVHTGDMTHLPFEAGSFDVVLSSLAIHNIKGAAQRATAIDEAVRVLRPEGRLVVTDIQATAQYAGRLRELGMADVSTRGLGWRGWYGGPWMATSAVTARKPA
jgi:SAM-dependent methyltransferase